MLSEIFWTFFITTTSGFILALARFCYKSKCKTIKCCKFIEIDRDVQVEGEEDALEIKYKNEQSKQSSNDNLNSIL